MYLGPAGTCWSTPLAAARALCADQATGHVAVSQAFTVVYTPARLTCVSATESGGTATLTFRAFPSATSVVESRPIHACEPARTNPFFLQPEEGALLAVAVVACWAAAWGLRALRRTLDDGDK